MSGVERLRECARLMRERAEAATPGPWRSFEQHGRDSTDEGWSQVGVTADAHDVALTYPTGFENDYPEPDAAYIAAMHPAVALAVADWLDRTARIFPIGDDGDPFILAGSTYEAALAVADAYLGLAPVPVVEAAGLEGERCVICGASTVPEDSGLCDAHKYDEQLAAGLEGETT